MLYTIDFLLELWEGISIGGSLIRGFIGIVACDLPAVRKLIGSTSYTACRGCTHCYQLFPTEYDEEQKRHRNYGIIDDDVKVRDMETWREEAKQYRECANENQRKKLAFVTGIRDSILLELHYLDLTKSVVFDPLHNILLGSAKAIWKLWLSQNILTKDILKRIEPQLKNIKVPADVGRSFHRFNGKLTRLTGNDMKIWLCVLSPDVLDGLIPDEHFDVWNTLRRFGVLVLNRMIKKTEIETVKTLAKDFLTKFKAVFGKWKTTPNMHFHLHVWKDLNRYGLTLYVRVLLFYI